MPRADGIALPFRVGPRTLWRVRRRLVRVPVSLAQGLAGEMPPLPPLDRESDGYLVTAVPAVRAEARGRHAGLIPFVRQSYQRCYAGLDGGYDAYLAGFSAKTRSTLKRKLRRFADRSGGAIDARAYATPEAMEDFYRHARAVSAKTYQERLLGAGLPEGREALEAMRTLARRDAVRAWLLFLDGEPVSYLYAPAEGDTLLYAYLGYDPAFADLSPGTVLQLEAMRDLMTENRFRLFDFTEGEGQHKRLFSTGRIDCVDLLLLRPTLANRLIGHGLAAFDGAVAGVKTLVAKLGLERLVRARLR
jgi:CelD/BcsL family acetyltransferase involved in cellulose biosynthesis